MKVFNRLNELQSIKKYSKYIDKELVPAVNKRIGLQLTPRISGDPFTCIFETNQDEGGTRMNIVFKFTTNRRDIDGLFWGTIMVAGRKDEIGSIIGELGTDLDVIEDAYYFLMERLVKKELI